MNVAQQETTLIQERMHWGIFSVPFLATVSIFVAMAPVFFGVSYLHGMFQSIQSIVPGAQMPTVNPIFYLPLLLPVAMGLISFVIVALARSKSMITLTNRRLMFRTGILSRTTGELPLENVEAIFLNETLLGRVLGFGTVVATGTGGIRFPLQFIGAVEQFHAALQSAVAAAKRGNQSETKSPPTRNDDARYMPKP